MIYDPKLIKTFKPNDDNTVDCECGNHIIPGTADMVTCACGRVFAFRDPSALLVRGEKITSIDIASPPPQVRFE